MIILVGRDIDFVAVCETRSGIELAAALFRGFLFQILPLPEVR